MSFDWETSQVQGTQIQKHGKMTWPVYLVELGGVPVASIQLLQLESEDTSATGAVKVTGNVWTSLTKKKTGHAAEQLLVTCSRPLNSNVSDQQPRPLASVVTSTLMLSNEAV